MLHTVPWGESATLTRVNHDSGFREQIASGPLKQMLGMIEENSWINRKDLRIAFADRGAPPFGYGPENFNELIRLAHQQS